MIFAAKALVLEVLATILARSDEVIEEQLFCCGALGRDWHEADMSEQGICGKAATTTIPIVFQIGFDPVALGLVASLNRPGGHLTGVTNLTVEVGVKQLEMLHELVPTATTIALLVNPRSPALAEVLSRDAQLAAGKLGVQLHVLHASSERDFDTVFATLAQLRVGALMIGADAVYISRSEQLAALAVRHAIPAAFHFRQFVVAGGLMSYGGSFIDAHRVAGVYVGRILKARSPSICRSCSQANSSW
jgi:ABC-type uncharacterized transport system substrate-binding protein